MTPTIEKAVRALAKVNGQEWERLPVTCADAVESIRNGGTAHCQADYLWSGVAVLEAVLEPSDEEVLAAMAAYDKEPRSGGPMRAALRAARLASLGR